MARTLTPERQNLRIWALQLAGLQLTQANIGRRLNVPQRTISAWLDNQAIPAKTCFFLAKDGTFSHNSGVFSRNIPRIHPPHPIPQLICAKAEYLPLPDNHVDLIITSPPYNLGDDEWAMGGNISLNGKGRTPREGGRWGMSHNAIPN